MGITAGKYKARATGEVVLGESKQKGTPFIELYFEVTEGEHKGSRARWTGYFGAGTSAARTTESLDFCGWTGDDLSDFADHELHGLDTNEVEIVVEIEEWVDKETEEPKSAPRVQWVNKPGGRVNVDNAMPPEKAQAFGAKMKGLIQATRARKPGGDGTDFPHGANAAPPPQAAAAGGTKRKAW
jgi:hypothetical protein